MAFEVDREMERLAEEIAALAGESEEEAVRQALREKRDRLGTRARAGGRPRTVEELRRFMEAEIWPLIPVEERGGPPMTKAERAKLLGYGPDDEED